MPCLFGCLSPVVILNLHSFFLVRIGVNSYILIIHLVIIRGGTSSIKQNIKHIPHCVFMCYWTMYYHCNCISTMCRIVLKIQSSVLSIPVDYNSAPYAECRVDVSFTLKPPLAKCLSHYQLTLKGNAVSYTEGRGVQHVSRAVHPCRRLSGAAQV